MRMMLSALLGLSLAAHAWAAPILLSDPSGLSAEVEFTIIDPTTLQVRVRNTSTGVPPGFDSADQLLTVVSWDFGLPGNQPGDPRIIGGTVRIGPTSASVNFSTGSYGPGTDVSGEYGFSNLGISGFLQNGFGAMRAGTTPFGGPNLDGPVNLDGPQGGLVADPVLVGVGGLGAIQNEIVATLLLDKPISGLGEVIGNEVRVEFGSDAAFITTPEPMTLCLLAVGGLMHVGRRRRGARLGG